MNNVTIFLFHQVNFNRSLTKCLMICLGMIFIDLAINWNIIENNNVKFENAVNTYDNTTMILNFIL